MSPTTKPKNFCQNSICSLKIVLNLESIISTLSSITSTLSTISSKVSTNTAYLVQIIALINALKRRSASIGDIIPAFIETNELFTTTTTTKGKQFRICFINVRGEF